MEKKANLIIFLEYFLFLALGLATIFFRKHFPTIKKINYSKNPLPPGPKGFPLIGCLPKIIKNKPTFRWIHKLMQEMNTEIACIRVSGAHIVPVTSPELSRDFLKKQDLVFSSRPVCMSSRITSSGFLTTAFSPLGDQWRKMRRILVAEVLSPKMHQRLHDKRCEEADHLVRYVYNQCRNPLMNGLVNVRIAARHYCGNVSRSLVFGKRFFGPGIEDGGPGIEEKVHLDGIFTVLRYVYGFAIADYIPWLQALDLDGHSKILEDAIKRLRKYQDPEINKRVEVWERGGRMAEADILDVMINLKDSKNNPLLSIQEIKAQITEIMLATMDNPSNAVEWAIAEMINQPEIFEKAQEELDRVVGRDRLVDESDLSKLNYIKACAKEAFRLHPIAPFNLPHVSTEDTVVGGYFIPKGSHVLLSRVGLGRNPRVWEEPLKYKPERHINSDDSGVVLFDSELRMISFGSGRRGCPGVALGTTIMTMLLARLIQGFNWSAPPDGPGVDLVESEHSLLLAKPLLACAHPRLKPKIYMELVQT